MIDKNDDQCQSTAEIEPIVPVGLNLLKVRNVHNARRLCAVLDHNRLIVQGHLALLIISDLSILGDACVRFSFQQRSRISKPITGDAIRSRIRLLCLGKVRAAQIVEIDHGNPSTDPALADSLL
jgi:hypothetical protein